MENDNYKQIFIIRNNKTEKVFVKINEKFFALGRISLKEGLDIFSRFIRKQEQSLSFNFLFSVTDSDMEVMVVLEGDRFYSVYDSLVTFCDSCEFTNLWLYKDAPGENSGCNYCVIDPEIEISLVNKFFSTNLLPGKFK